IDSRDVQPGGGGRAQTLFSLTAAGRQALATYVAQLSALVQLSRPGPAAATEPPLALNPLDPALKAQS
ncbi:MAG: hypothetical protein RIR00_632, partial [Pseudomonadota bacterium]